MKEIIPIVVFSSVLLILCVALYPKNTEAIPAFSRKHKSSCVLCHAQFPRLTAFGNTFWLIGYKFPERDELYTKDEPVSIGAEAYKNVFPEAIWPSDIPGMPPISILAEGEVEVDTGGTKITRLIFSNYFNAKDFFTAQTLNHCMDGMCFKSANPLKLGKTISIRVKSFKPNALYNGHC